MSHINFVEAMCMIFICAIADTMEFIITILGDLAGAGEIVKWVIDFITFATVGLWLILKGARGTWFYIGSLIELVPLANAFPTRTITMVATIHANNKAITTHV